MLTFSKSEENQRKQIAFIGAVEAVVKGEVPDEWLNDPNKNNYTHPNALANARRLTNNTMFSMSAQNLPPAFRAGMGQWLLKFKNYLWNQSKREFTWGLNAWNSLTSAERKEMFTHFVYTVIPPYFGIDKWTLAKAGINYGSKGPPSTMRKFKTFLWSRVLASVISTGMHIPFITPIWRYFRKIAFNSPYGLGARALQSGGESTIASSALIAILYFYAIAGMLGKEYDEEDEEFIKQDFYRWYLPFYMNTAINWGMPMIRTYSNSAYKAINASHDFLKFIGIANDEKER